MASEPLPLDTSKSFNLDKNITLGGTSLAIKVSASSDHDVVDAILTGKQFPDRNITLADISLQEQTDQSLTLGTLGGSITFGLSGGLGGSAGVFKSAADATAALQLDDTPKLTLPASETGNDRFLVM